MSIPFNPIGRLARCVCLVMLVPVAAPPLVHAQSSGAIASELPIAELKSLYLGCERAAVAGHLGGGEVVQCSIFYEELKRRAFGGDFKSMRTWSAAQCHVSGIAPSSFEQGS